MSALTALINVFGKIAVLLVEAQIKLVFALGQALGAGIRALWQARQQRPSPRGQPSSHRSRRSRPRRRAYR